MAFITDILNTIKNAHKGKDMRQAIYDGIQQCYEDATGHPDSVAAAVKKIGEVSANLSKETADRKAEVNTERKRIDNLIKELPATAGEYQQSKLVLHSYDNAAVKCTTTSGNYTNVPAFTTDQGGPLSSLYTKKSNYQIAVNKSGLYLFELRIHVNSLIANKRVELAPFVNDTRIAALASSYNTAGNFTLTQVAALPLWLSANDTVDFRIAPIEAAEVSLQLGDVLVYAIDWEDKFKIPDYTGYAAETKDIRTGADGTVYGTAGEAVRKQIGNITEDLGNYELKNDLAVVNYEFEHFGYISSNGGNISSTENAKYTNFIRVHAGDKFEVKAPIGDAGYSIACYDSNEKILIDSSVKGNYSGLFTVPEGVEFIRCSFYGLKNTAYCRSCPKYNFPELKAYVSSNIDEINNFGIKLEGLKPQFTEKGYLMTTDGTVEKSDYGKCTDFFYIPRDATNIKNHTVNGDYTVASGCFYDSEKNYIASLTTTERDVDIDITAEEYSSAEYVRLSYYNYKSDDSIGPNGIIYNKESVEIRFSKVDERIKNIEGFGSANLNVLIFGDSITDCASFTVSNDVTTKYNFSGMNTYINANGETIKYKMWPKIFESKMKCKDLRNYARSGASYKNDARESGEERRNLSYQIQLAINDVDNAGGAFNQSHFEPDIIIFALGTNDGVPNDTPASAYSKIITTGTGIDVSATLSNLDMSKFCESVIYAYMQIRKYFPYAMIFNVLPIQRMANDVPLGTAHDYLKEISQKIANAIIIDGAYESGIIKQNNLVSGLGETLKDGLHPNEKGQNMMARMIISKVKSHYVSFDNMND